MEKRKNPILQIRDEIYLPSITLLSSATILSRIQPGWQELKFLRDSASLMFLLRFQTSVQKVLWDGVGSWWPADGGWQ